MRDVKKTMWAVTIGIFMAPGPAPAADKAPDSAAAAKGKVTYVRFCVSCHGPGGRGDGSLAGDLRVTVPDLTTMAQRNGGRYPYDRVVRLIQGGEPVRGHGTPDMPAWGDAFKKTKGTEEPSVGAAVRDVTHHLWTLQQPAR